MSLIFATQLTAMATLGLAVLALAAAILAGLAFRKQSQEVGILIEQNREHQQALERDTAERHREQASRVWVMMVPDDATKRDFPANRPGRGPATGEAADGPWLEALVRNTSEHQLPIFHAKLHWYRGSDPYGDPELLRDVPGYENTARSRAFPSGTDLSTCGALLTFHDAAGFGWMRAPGGALTEHPPGELDAATIAAIRARANGSSPPSPKS